LSNASNVLAAQNVTFLAGGDITLEQTVSVTAHVNVTFTSVTGSILVGAPYTLFVPSVSGACTTAACSLNPYETQLPTPEVTSLATVTATTGQVLWQADRNVTQSSLSTTTASQGIQIYGDYLNNDLTGTVITLAGTLTVTTPWSSVTNAPLIQIFGYSHDDQFSSSRPRSTGARGRTARTCRRSPGCSRRPATATTRSRSTSCRR
jgi:hypothetical protein